MASSSKTPTPAASVFQLIFSIAVLCGLIYFQATLISTYSEGRSTHTWPKVVGVVKTSDAQRVGSGRNQRVVAIVRYEYEVNGATYKGDRICVDGYTIEFSESAQAVSDRYVVGHPCSVYYNPNRPEIAVLVCGVPASLWLSTGISLAMTLVMGATAYGSVRNMLGKPSPTAAQRHDGERKPIDQIASLIFCGVMLFGVCGMTLFQVVMMFRKANLQGGVAVWIFAPIMLALAAFAAFAGFAQIRFALQRKPSKTLIEADPDAPTFSENSLICLQEGLGGASAIILDHEAGMIHFRNCFGAPGLFWKTKPWFSAPLTDIKSWSEFTGRGITTLTVHLPDGRALIHSTATNFNAFKEHLSNVKQTYGFGQAPMNWKSMLIFFGTVGGLVLGFMWSGGPRDHEMMLLLKPLGGAVIGGGSCALFVWTIGGFKEEV